MGYIDQMDVRTAKQALKGLNRCLPRTPGEDRGCGGCPYQCDPGERLIGLPARIIEDARQVLEQAARGTKETDDGGRK